MKTLFLSILVVGVWSASSQELDRTMGHETDPDEGQERASGQRGRGEGRRGNQLARLTRDIAQCQGVFYGPDSYAGVPCPGKVLKCLKKAHKLTKRCIGQELKVSRQQGEVARMCQRTRRPELRKWFELTCLHHTSINKCTKGEQVPTDLQFPSDPEPLSENPHAYLEATDCWTKVGKAKSKCEKLAERECPKFMVCSGKSESPENQWKRTIANLNSQKDVKLVELQKSIKSCVHRQGNN